MQDDRSLNESRQLAEELLNAQRELLNDDSNAHTLLQQLIKQILYAPIVSEKCPKQMRDWILFCTSYAKAEISIKMPYILTLDKRIGDLYQKHHEFVTPALLITRGRARNVTVELNTTHKSVPNSRVMSRGQSQYISYPKQQVSNAVEIEARKQSKQWGKGFGRVCSFSYNSHKLSLPPTLPLFRLLQLTRRGSFLSFSLSTSLREPIVGFAVVCFVFGLSRPLFCCFFSGL